MAHRLKESLEENPSTTAKLLPSCPTTVGDEVLAMLKWWESWRIMSQDPLCMFWDVIKTSLKFPPVFVEKNMTSSMQRMFHLYKIHSKKTGCLLLNHGFSPPVSCYYSWAPAVFPCSLSRTSRWLLVEVRLFFGCAVCAFERWQSWKIPWVLRLIIFHLWEFLERKHNSNIGRGGECREIFKRHESTLDVHLSQWLPVVIKV